MTGDYRTATLGQACQLLWLLAKGAGGQAQISGGDLFTAPYDPLVTLEYDPWRDQLLITAVDSQSALPAQGAS